MKSIALFTLSFLLGLQQLTAQNLNFIQSNNPSVTIDVEDDVEIINWEVQKEVNASFYIIEKSDNGVDFYQVATVKAKGYSTVSTQYSLEQDATDSLMQPVYKVILVAMDGMRTVAYSAQSLSADTQYLASKSVK